MTDFGSTTNNLNALSNDLGHAVARISPSLVRLDDGSRFTATGTVWTADGIIVTTSHGVERDEDLAIVTADGERHSATLIGRDNETDIAALRVSGVELSPATRRDESTLRVGHIALAVGRPGSGGIQATFGIISAVLEAQSDGRPEHILHTDAVVYPGFSGGLLIDTHGHAVGLLNRSLGRGQGVALGLSLVQNVVDDLILRGTVKRGYLGVSTQAVTLPAAAVALTGRDQLSGLLAVEVAAGSAAETAGLLLGDTIIALDGEPVASVDDLRGALRHLGAGHSVALQIVRAGKLAEINAVLGAA